MSSSTRDVLLAAAEGILVEKGVNAISVRKVGEAAGLSPALVTYHFKSILNLLDELCQLNLDPILEDWKVIGAEAESGETALDEVLQAWLAPMLRQAAFTPRGRALVVLDEIAARGEASLSGRVLAAMQEFSARLRGALSPLVPHLSDHELRARVRFISAAVLGPPPRGHSYAPTEAGAFDDLKYLVPFARAALSG